MTYLQDCKAEKPFLEMDLDVKVTSLISEHWSDPRSPSSAYPRTPILVILFQNIEFFKFNFICYLTFIVNTSGRTPNIIVVGHFLFYN